MQPHKFDSSDREIAGLSYGRFIAIRHKFHCQLPSREPLVIDRKVLHTEIFEWETRSAANTGRLPNTSKHSTQYQNKLKK
jgi:hypothetical protein